MQDAANIVLVGPMGAGKSTLGRRLATRLGLGFMDVDAEIERIAGASIPHIFSTEGEAGFRARESQALAEVLARGGQVVATGGGAVLAAGNREAMRTAGTVVYLQVNPRMQLRRVGNDRNRPLLASGDPARTLARLQAQREPLYREVADFVFDTSTRSPAAAADALASLLSQREERRA